MNRFIQGIAFFISGLCIITVCTTPQETALVPLYNSTIISPAHFLFAHGLWDNKNQAKTYAQSEKNNWYLFTGPYFSFNFPDTGYYRFFMKCNKVNIGQHNDIDALTNAYVKILCDQKATHTQENIVLTGVSRGAMTILNAAATQSLPQLKAIIAEAPADSVFTMIDYLLKSYNVNWPWLIKSTDYIISKFWFTDYDRDGISPLSVINQINKNTPILFVHSKSDGFVSINCSRALYYKLVGSNHHEVYLLELNHGTHSKYNLGRDAHTYQITVHAFYKKYGIPHDPKLAKEGEKILNQCQPSLEEVAQRLT